MSKNVINVKILGDNKDLNRKLDSAGSKLGTFAKNAGKVGAVAVAAAGVGIVKLGVDLDKALDNIIIGTGATGESLEGLKGSFESVASNVPSSFGDVSTAIADVNTRLGLTGKPLEDLSTQFLDLSRLTGTDVSANVANMTRVFGDAGVAAEDQGAALDTLFRASQTSGIGLDQLSTTLVSFGAPMRQLGFSFEESTALLSKFELEGVNTEAVMAGLKVGLGKMAKAGEEPAETLDRVIDSIKGAGSAGEANTLALEAFGQRAGPDMAAAIREGRFEIGDMMDALGDSDGAISDTADATESWTEKLGILKNKALIKLAPVAERVFDGIERAVAAVTPHLQTFADWLSVKIPPALETASVAFDEIKTAVSTAFDWMIQNKDLVLGAVVAVGVGIATLLVPPLIASAAASIAAAAPFIALAVLLAALGAAVVYAYQEFGWFQTAVDAVVTFFTETAWPAIQAFAGFIADAFQALVGFVRTHWDTIQSVVKGVWDFISKYVSNVIGIVQGVIDTVMGVISGDWGRAWDGIKGILSSVWDQIKLIVGLALDAVKLAVSLAWDAVKATVSAAIDGVKSYLSTKWDEIVTKFEDVWNGLSTFVSDTWADIEGFVSGGIDEVVGFFTGMPGSIASAVSGGFDSIYDGFKGVINRVIDAWNSISLGPFTIPGFDSGIPGVPSFGDTTLGPYGPPTIPRLAEGGIVTGPTLALIGDNRSGREAVVPLERADEFGFGRGEGGPTVQIGEVHMHNGTDVNALSASLVLAMAA